MRGSDVHGAGEPSSRRAPESPPLAHRPAAIYLAGNGHSGSTLLELLLATGPDVVGLGEVGSVLRIVHRQRGRTGRAESMVCSCRAATAACDFWGPVLPRLRAAAATEPEEIAFLHLAYPMVLEAFGAAFPEATLVDASKDEGALAVLATAVGGDLATVHLIRDVRSWATSSRARARSKEDLGVAALLRRPRRRTLALRLHHTYLGRFRRWHRRNLQFDRALGDRREPVVRVSYEELATDPRVLRSLRRHLALEAPEGPADRPSLATAHSVGGNRMRLSADATSEVVYSTGWLRERGWVLPSLVLRSTMRYNAERVYGSPLAADPIDAPR